MTTTAPLKESQVQKAWYEVKSLDELSKALEEEWKAFIKTTKSSLARDLLYYSIATLLLYFLFFKLTPFTFLSTNFLAGVVLLISALLGVWFLVNRDYGQQHYFSNFGSLKEQEFIKVIHGINSKHVNAEGKKLNDNDKAKIESSLKDSNHNHRISSLKLYDIILVILLSYCAVTIVTLINALIAYPKNEYQSHLFVDAVKAKNCEALYSDSEKSKCERLLSFDKNLSGNYQIKASGFEEGGNSACLLYLEKMRADQRKGDLRSIRTFSSSDCIQTMYQSGKIVQIDVITDYKNATSDGDGGLNIPQTYTITPLEK